MRTKHKKRQSPPETIAYLLAGLLALGTLITALLHGKNIAVFNSKGFIASQQRGLIIFACIVVLSIAIPTLTLLYFVAWRYRESNGTSTYHPEANRGKMFSFGIWALPTAFMIVLAIVLVPATHKLQPNKAIASSVKPLSIQVLAMRWKWVFIYPDQQIATVNYVQIPRDVPVVFDLTADEAPMSSFWIPNLGGQLYAMTGHINRLNLIANKTGDFQGRSAEINGTGFEGMKFNTKVTSDADFHAWVQEAQHSPPVLDKTAYDALLKPSQNNTSTIYSSVDDTLYANAVMKYAGAHNHYTSHKESNDQQMTQQMDMHK